MEEPIDDNNNLLVIGLTGGIGSGKSALASILAGHGFPVINTDDLAKKVIADDAEVKAAILEEFGDDAISGDKINAKFIGDIVFGDDEEKLESLNRIVHPPVIDAMIAEIERLKDLGESIIFVESALIYSAGIDDGFDYIVAVVANDEQRIERLQSSRQMSRGDIVKRMKSQISQEQLVTLADFTIENKGTIHDLERSAEFIMSLIQSLPPKNFENK